MSEDSVTEFEVEELEWDGDDLVIKAVDGKKWRFTNAYPVKVTSVPQESNEISVQEVKIHCTPVGIDESTTPP